MFKAVKQGKKWAVIDTRARVFYYVRGGRRACEKLAKDLNRGQK